MASGWLQKFWGKPEKLNRVNLEDFTGTVYAIGDVHGCLDLLLGLEGKIFKDASESENNLLIYMGDYIDRGPDSYGVIEHLMSQPPTGFRRICLKGNHEDLMLRFVGNPASAQSWLKFGGRQTLLSYGAQYENISSLDPKSRKTRFLLERILPEEHLEFLGSLPHVVELKRFFLAHAGVNPTKSLSSQSVRDILWGRTEFLQTPQAYEKDIVHGHYVVEHAAQTVGKVSIDTGAYASGKLTAAKLDFNGAVEFLSFQNANG